MKDIAEAHLCCGSAGTYNIMQPDIAARLRDRKVANIERTGADVIAAGNIGCITQIAAATAIPVVHTVELLDWANGGPVPEALASVATMTRMTRDESRRSRRMRHGRRARLSMCTAAPQDDRARP